MPRRGFEGARALSGDREKLALKVVELARSELLAQHHYLSAALGRLPLTPRAQDCAFATDGKRIAFDPQRVLDAFAESRVPPVHDLLHCVLHCMLLHPFQKDPVDVRLWDLACDICVERLAALLCGQRAGRRGIEAAQAIVRVETACSGNIGAQRVYRRLQAGSWEGALDAWEALFRVDEHAVWHAPQLDWQQGEGESAGSGEDDLSSTAQAEAGDDAGAQYGAPVGREVESVADEGLRESWKHITRTCKAALESMPRERGVHAGALVEEVEAATRERVDYAQWLRQFAQMGEHLRLSDEEFDPVFYTFGLRRYGNLPLIEPLEQREERRIREFVIVIDTSQSVSGEIVRRFVDETCTILGSSVSFADRLHVHVVQCDTQVQSDDVLTSLEDLAAWGRSVELRGFGGHRLPARLRLCRRARGGRHAEKPRRTRVFHRWLGHLPGETPRLSRRLRLLRRRSPPRGSAALGRPARIERLARQNGAGEHIGVFCAMGALQHAFSATLLPEPKGEWREYPAGDGTDPRCGDRISLERRTGGVPHPAYDAASDHHARAPGGGEDRHRRAGGS